MTRAMPALNLNPASVYSTRLSAARPNRPGARPCRRPSNSISVIFRPDAAYAALRYGRCGLVACTRLMARRVTSRNASVRRR